MGSATRTTTTEEDVMFPSITPPEWKQLKMMGKAWNDMPMPWWPDLPLPRVLARELIPAAY